MLQTCPVQPPLVPPEIAVTHQSYGYDTDPDSRLHCGRFNVNKHTLVGIAIQGVAVALGAMTVAKHDPEKIVLGNLAMSGAVAASVAGVVYQSLSINANQAAHARNVVIANAVGQGLFAVYTITIGKLTNTIPMIALSAPSLILQAVGTLMFLRLGETRFDS
jgi:hypothetical protein